MRNRQAPKTVVSQNNKLYWFLGEVKMEKGRNERGSTLERDYTFFIFFISSSKRRRFAPASALDDSIFIRNSNLIACNEIYIVNFLRETAQYEKIAIYNKLKLVVCERKKISELSHLIVRHRETHLLLMGFLLKSS